MKKIIPAVLAALTLTAALALTGCATTSETASSGSSGKTSASKSSISVKMYNNVPENNTYAAAAVLTLKLTNKSYSGVSTYQYIDTPVDVTPVLSYYAQCEAIRAAIAAGEGSCTLSFNTQANGGGTTLVFNNSPSQVIKTLLTMAVKNYTTVYAIYRY